MSSSYRQTINRKPAGPRQSSIYCLQTPISTKPKTTATTKPRRRDISDTNIDDRSSSSASLHRNFASNKQSGMTGTRISRSPTSRLPSDQRRLRKPRKRLPTLLKSRARQQRLIRPQSKSLKTVSGPHHHLSEKRYYLRGTPRVAV